MLDKGFHIINYETNFEFLKYESLEKFEDFLKEQNFQVRSAANYDQAVLEINKRLPDLAIIDIKLDKPDKDNEEATSAA